MSLTLQLYVKFLSFGSLRKTVTMQNCRHLLLRIFFKSLVKSLPGCQNFLVFGTIANSTVSKKCVDYVQKLASTVFHFVSFDYFTCFLFKNLNFKSHEVFFPENHIFCHKNSIQRFFAGRKKSACSDIASFFVCK